MKLWSATPAPDFISSIGRTANCLAKIEGVSSEHETPWAHVCLTPVSAPNQISEDARCGDSHLGALRASTSIG